MGKGSPKQSKYEVTAYQLRALQFLRPPENLTVSQWAAKYRILDAKTSAMPGRWRNSRTPYMVGVMDALNDYEVEEVIGCMSAQVGKSENILNCLGYVIMNDPSPVLMVFPTDKLGDSISQNRILPMVYACQELRARYDFLHSQKNELQFEGMYVSIEGSNSPSGLASKAIKYLFMDEVDKYPGASNKEADPISLARERTKTFATRKIVMTSTPTIREGPIWKALEGADVERHYFVPCPHCGQMIELKFKQLRWPDKDEGLSMMERAERTVYVCQECGAVITDQHKDRMIRNGEWRDVEVRSPVHRRVAFWLNTLYSPFVRFSEIALEFMRSKKDPERLQNFVNSWLAEPWEDTNLKTSADMVLERQTDVPAMVIPEWAMFLTGGVDVQRDSLYWTIRAWGPYITSQNIAHGQVLSWAEIERVMSLPYERPDGVQMMVQLCLVDAGYEADDTYLFYQNHPEWVRPVKGRSAPMNAHYMVNRVNRPGHRFQGTPLVHIDTGKYKDMIASRMRKPNGEGSWMVYKDCDREYAEQVTAEHKINVKSGHRTVQRWVEKRSHADNHYLDCEVYALAAADMLGVRTLHLEQEQEQSDPVEYEVPAGENSWLGTGGERWI